MEDNSDEKLVKCWVCAELYPESDFGRTPLMNWFTTRCIHCKRKAARLRMKIYQNTKECRARDIVRAKTRYLIKSGKIVAEKKCAKCGRLVDLQIHHTTKPYDPYKFVYLCRKICHEAEHPERFNAKGRKKK